MSLRRQLILALLLVSASCQENKEDTRPPIPAGVRDACTTDADCNEGQVCVLETRSGAGWQYDYPNTCWPSCESDDDCDFAGTACHSCETSVSAPFCDWYGCK